MKQEITMGSLFSGSGGFELAGSIFGIRPIWASEIEPFPILVTTKNFPEMKHLGDINKLNGADLEPVTITRAAEIPETMTALPMDLVSENREHLPTHSRPQTGTE